MSVLDVAIGALPYGRHWRGIKSGQEPAWRQGAGTYAGQ